MDPQTTDHGGAKHTFDSNNKRTDDEQSFNNEHQQQRAVYVSNNEDLDKTTSIFALQQSEKQRIISEQLSKKVVQQ
jgi:hypothetical protein